MAHPGLSLGREGVGVPHLTVLESLGMGLPSAEERDLLWARCQGGCQHQEGSAGWPWGKAQCSQNWGPETEGALCHCLIPAPAGCVLWLQACLLSSVPFLLLCFESPLHSRALVSADLPLTPGGGPTPSLCSPRTHPCSLDSVRFHPSFTHVTINTWGQHQLSAKPCFQS